MMRSLGKKAWVILATAGLCWAAADIGAGPSPGPGKLIVHEWGTFLGVQGSDGVALGGMVGSEEKLPPFVRERALDGRSQMNFKMETPVTYFYVDRPRTVQVRVAMNGGQLTHWFPAVRSFGPPFVKGKPPLNTFLDWGTVELTPDTRANAVGPQLPVPGLPEVAWGDTWRFVRDTDSALVRVAQRGRSMEAEKFLFYRGVGSLDLPLRADFASTPDRRVPNLTLHNRGKDPIAGIFWLRVDKDAIRFEAVSNLAGGGERSLGPRYAEKPTVPLAEGVPQVKKALAAALVRAGLYPKEAQAMVNNWEKSYFWTEGLRVLYILPRPRVDEIIPIQIKPAPDQLVRVMVGRLEVLTPDKEQRLERAVADLGSPNPQVRKAAGAELSHLGRFEEPVLRRVMAKTTDPQVRGRAESLITQLAKGK